MTFNLLVVDDSVVMRALIVRPLRLSGLPLCEVYAASNGTAGLRVLDEHWIDLAAVRPYPGERAHAVLAGGGHS